MSFFNNAVDHRCLGFTDLIDKQACTYILDLDGGRGEEVLVDAEHLDMYCSLLPDLEIIRGRKIACTGHLYVCLS